MIIVVDAAAVVVTRGVIKSVIAESGIKFNFNKPPISALSFRRVLAAVPIIHDSDGKQIICMSITLALEMC